MNLHSILTEQSVFLIRATNDDGYALVWFVATESQDEANEIARLVERAGFYEAEADKILPGWITPFEDTKNEIIRDYELDWADE